MQCPNCKLGACESCVDALRKLYTSEMICSCTRKLHDEKRDGEPNLKQIRDPETETVHAPGLEVSIDGEVKFRDGFDPFGSA